VSKIKRKYLESFLYGFTLETLTANKTITPSNNSKYIFDPNGVTRDITFTGDFQNGDIISIKNNGINNLNITNTSTIIHKHEKFDFIFSGSNWYIINASGLFDIDENGDLMPKD